MFLICITFAKVSTLTEMSIYVGSFQNILYYLKENKDVYRIMFPFPVTKNK